EADTQSNLPERNARRQDQRKEHRGDEETLVDLMLADGSKEHLPETADYEGHGIDGHEPGGAMDDVVPDARRIEPGKHGNQINTTAVLGFQQLGVARKDAAGLVAYVPHAEEHCREGTQPDGDHHPLEVDTVPHVGGGFGHAGG